LERAIILSGRRSNHLARLGYAYGRAGRKAEALAIARELEELSKVRYGPAFDRCLVSLGLDDKDQALFWLQKAYEEREVSVSNNIASPFLDSVRDDPRFQDMLRRMNYPGK